MIARKQTAMHEDFLSAMRRIESVVSRRELDSLIEATVAEIVRVTDGKNVGFGWSGGKDSVVLQGVCDPAGIERCCLGMTNLEYPAFLEWVTDHMPARLEVFNNGWDLDWLFRHEDMLFPKDNAIAVRWFRGVNHWGQDRFVRRHRLDMILVGRRYADGNYIGRDGGVYTNRSGITRYSPIRDWTHEQVLAYLHYHKRSMPPCYRWPRGFRVGTGSWPARQWTRSIMHGWSEVWEIDKGIVMRAATKIESAKRFVGSIR